MKQKKLNILSLAAIALFTILAPGCASTNTERRIDSKLEAEPAVSDSNSLGGEFKTMIDQSQKLTLVQKNQLLALQTDTRTQLNQLKNQSLKLRSILIKDVMQAGYNPDEIEIVKERLKKTEDRRLTVIFNAVDHAETIIGNELPENEGLLRSFYEIRLYD